MRHVLLAASLLCAGTAQAQQLVRAQYEGVNVDCTDWQSGTQLVLNVCAYRAWKAADEEMNVVWRAARAKARRLDAALAKTHGPEGPLPAVWGNLLDGQRAWITYRRTFCAASRARYFGGSMEPMVASMCRLRITKARVRELQAFAGEY